MFFYWNYAQCSNHVFRFMMIWSIYIQSSLLLKMYLGGVSSESPHSPCNHPPAGTSALLQTLVCIAAPQPLIQLNAEQDIKSVWSDGARCSAATISHSDQDWIPKPQTSSTLHFAFWSAFLLKVQKVLFNQIGSFIPKNVRLTEPWILWKYNGYSQSLI